MRRKWTKSLPFFHFFLFFFLFFLPFIYFLSFFFIFFLYFSVSSARQSLTVRQNGPSREGPEGPRPTPMPPKYRPTDRLTDQPIKLQLSLRPNGRPTKFITTLLITDPLSIVPTDRPSSSLLPHHRFTVYPTDRPTDRPTSLMTNDETSLQ